MQMPATTEPPDAHVDGPGVRRDDGAVGDRDAGRRRAGDDIGKVRGQGRHGAHEASPLMYMRSSILMGHPIESSRSIFRMQARASSIPTDGSLMAHAE